MRKYFLLVAILILSGALLSGCTKTPQAGTYDALAKCLTEKNVKMYGAYWCTHCKDQKDKFGSSFQYVHYVECAVQGQPNVVNQVCKDADIKGYPTWVFPDGTRLSGAQDLETLADKAQCPLTNTNVNQSSNSTNSPSNQNTNTNSSANSNS